MGNRLYRKAFLKPDGEETIAQWFARRLSDADLDVEEKYRIARIPIPHEPEHAFRPGTRNPTHSTGVAHMMPIAPLMIEHRLIERVIDLLKEALREAEQEQRVNPRFVEHATRFVREYADRCHHGKEEDILFRELGKKPMTEGHLRIMAELVQDHRWGRKTTRSLVAANRRYEQGDTRALYEVTEHIRSLVDFYPRHIEKEDKGFFLPVMKYFSDEEKDRMLKEEHAFDSDLLHEEWDELVSSLEGGPRSGEKAASGG